MSFRKSNPGSTCREIAHAVWNCMNVCASYFEMLCVPACTASDASVSCRRKKENGELTGCAGSSALCRYHAS